MCEISAASPDAVSSHSEASGGRKRLGPVGWSRSPTQNRGCPLFEVIAPLFPRRGVGSPPRGGVLTLDPRLSVEDDGVLAEVERVQLGLAELLRSPLVKSPAGFQAKLNAFNFGADYQPVRASFYVQIEFDRDLCAESPDNQWAELAGRACSSSPTRASSLSCRHHKARRTSPSSAPNLRFSTALSHCRVTPMSRARLSCVRFNSWRRPRISAPISLAVRRCRLTLVNDRLHPALSSFVDIFRRPLPRVVVVVAGSS